MKDDFVSTVTHELRTPLTSIRAFTEILHDNPQLRAAQRKRFLGIVIKETERLTRLISQVLDVSRSSSRAASNGTSRCVDMTRGRSRTPSASTSQLFKERNVAARAQPARSACRR